MSFPIFFSVLLIGRSGSGKSTFILNLIKNYHKKKKRKVFYVNSTPPKVHFKEIEWSKVLSIKKSFIVIEDIIGLTPKEEKILLTILRESLHHRNNFCLCTCHNTKKVNLTSIFQDFSYFVFSKSMPESVFHFHEILKRKIVVKSELESYINRFKKKMQENPKETHVIFDGVSLEFLSFEQLLNFALQPRKQSSSKKEKESQETPPLFDDYIHIYQGKQEVAKILHKMIFQNDKVRHKIKFHDNHLTFSFQSYQLSILDCIYMLLFSDIKPSKQYQSFFQFVKRTVHIPQCLIQNVYLTKIM